MVQFLTQKSKELDPEHVGINFVLNLNAETPPADTGTANRRPHCRHAFRSHYGRCGNRNDLDD